MLQEEVVELVQQVVQEDLLHQLVLQEQEEQVHQIQFLVQQ